MCSTLSGTVFLKHKPSQTDPIVIFCYPLSALLMMKVSLLHKAWKGSTSALEFSGNLLFFFLIKLVKKLDKTRSVLNA